MVKRKNYKEFKYKCNICKDLGYIEYNIDNIPFFDICECKLK